MRSGRSRIEAGLGTNVELWLPQSAAAADAADIVHGPATPAVVGTALLVDDEEFVRMSTADMLHDLGYTVIEAASAEDAMRLVDEGRHFDLLVTDHLMPGLNGTDLALAVRSMKPRMPVLLVSGYAENEGIDPGLPRLTKPFRRDELATSLTQLASYVGESQDFGSEPCVRSALIWARLTTSRTCSRTCASARCPRPGAMRGPRAKSSPIAATVGSIGFEPFSQLSAHSRQRP